MTVTIIIFIVCYARISTVAKSHRRKLQYPSSVLRQEEALPNKLPQRTCSQWSIKVSPINKQGIQSTNENLPNDKRTCSNEPKLIKKSEQVQVHSLQQEYQRKEMRHGEAIASSLLPEKPNYGKLCSTKEALTNRKFPAKVISQNSIQNMRLDPAISQKSVHNSLAQRGNRKSSKNRFDLANFAASRSSDVKDLADSIQLHADDVKVSKNTDVQSENNKHTSNHVPVSLASNGKYNINKGEQKKKTNTVAILIFVAVLCYGPLAIIYILRAIIGDTFEIVYMADPWADLILYVNSTINPIVYCLHGKEFRGAVKGVLPRCLTNIFRNMTSCKRSNLQQSS